MTRRFLVAAALLPAVLALSACGQSIESGHRGVYYNWRTGTDTSQVLGEGFHWLAPWNKIIVYDARTKDRIESLTVLSEDQLQIKTDVSVRYRLEPNQVAKLHVNVGPEFYQQLIQPVLRNTTRDTVSRYRSIEAYRNREKLQTEIQTALGPALEKHDYFTVESVMLRKMDFPDMVVQAIERKLSMKQEADREQFALEKEKIIAQRKVVQAQATADAQRILKSELNDILLRWKGIEATMQLAESANSKVVVIGSGKDGLPLILGGAEK